MNNICKNHDNLRYLNATIYLVLFLFNIVGVHAQEDTLYHKIDSVEVVDSYVSPSIKASLPAQFIYSQELQILPALQLSDAVKLLSGTIVRDYGGIGGLKTVSIRGLSAQHTGVSYDGVSLSDCQTGQIDLGKIPMENIQQITLNNGQDEALFQSARQLASGAVINVATQKPSYSDSKPVSIFASLTGGGFGLINSNLLIQNRLTKNTFQSHHPSKSTCKAYSSFNVNYLQSKGDYPFTLFYGGVNDSTSMEKRNNSDIKTLSMEGNIHILFKDTLQLAFQDQTESVLTKKGELNIKLFYYKAERGLPGAVILYRTITGERLWNDDAFAQIHFEYAINRSWKYQLYAKSNYSRTRYLDPHFLNQDGKIDNEYKQYEYYLSNGIKYERKQWNIFLVNDLFYNNLDANTHFFVSPSRVSCLTALGTQLIINRVKISGSFLHTYAQDFKKTVDSTIHFQKVSPTVSFGVKILNKEEFYFRFFFKNIFRLPTFNDLYYRDIGNTDLAPENTFQWNGGLTFSKKFWQKRFTVSTTIDGYYNFVKDKIVVIPSKNLFIWSMMNYGKVNIYGVDFTVDMFLRINKSLSFLFSGVYNFQHALDITDPNSKTYLNQLPYTPEHAGSICLLFQTKWIDAGYTLLLSGKRYTLAQNTEQNMLPGYIEQSISLSKDYSFTEKKQTKDVSKSNFSIGIKVELLNITDTQYEIVKNFPMQGRSIRAKILFKW